MNLKYQIISLILCSIFSTRGDPARVEGWRSSVCTCLYRSDHLDRLCCDPNTKLHYSQALNFEILKFRFGSKQQCHEIHIKSFALLKFAGAWVKSAAESKLYISWSLISQGHDSKVPRHPNHVEYIIHNTQYTIIQCTIHNIQYTKYNIQFTTYNIQFTIHNTHHTELHNTQ